MFEEIENTCERIIMIKDGRMVADEDINNMRSEMNKHYEITFPNVKDAMEFQKQYPGGRKENTVYLLSKENVNHLLSELCKYQIMDLNVRYQTLEEVFMKYYGGDKK